MTQPEGTPPDAAITEKIIADAREQAEKLIRNAGVGAAAEQKKTEREIERIEQGARAGWDLRVEKIRMSEISTARIESRRILLDAREKAVSGLFAEIEEGLGCLREDRRRYRESLVVLAVEAVTAIGGSGVVLKFGETDRDIVDEAFLGEVRSGVEGGAAGTDFTVEFADGEMGGGCVAASPDGRIVLDNTLGRRLEEMRPAIRATIVKELARDDE
jgi:vacuolar-type H+-ATPase subunit E/Vma4